MILLLRHGQTDWSVEPARCQGWADVPLNEAGRAQARERARALAGRGLQHVVTSHLRRARETADMVRDALAMPAYGPRAALALTVDPRLAETHRGAWQGRAFDDIIRDDPAGWRAYREAPEHWRFPGGESLAEQQRRVLAALRDVALDGRPTLVVTHGGSIRLVRCFLAGEGPARFHRHGVGNGAAELLDVPDLTARIETFLEASHDAGQGKPHS